MTNRLPRRRFLGSAACVVVSVAARPVAAVRDETGVVPVPAGAFLAGSDAAEIESLARASGMHPSWFAGEIPRRSVELPAFAIDRYPVTNRRYVRFVAATGHRAPAHWGAPRPPEAILDHPVVYVDRADARAFAAWSGGRLPTRDEWEKAARGPEGRRWPWGDEFDPARCRWNAIDPAATPPSPTGLERDDDWWPKARARDGAGTSPVDAHPAGASPYGVMDMAGNVAEWCADPEGYVAWIKGGSWATENPLELRGAALGTSGAENNLSPSVGFRTARDVAA